MKEERGRKVGEREKGGKREDGEGKKARRKREEKMSTLYIYLLRYSTRTCISYPFKHLSAAGSSPQGHSEVANMMAVEEGREWSVEKNIAWNVSVVTSHQELIRGIIT